jgi:hypothetical protein
MSHQHQTVYRLRNHPDRCFSIDASVSSHSPRDTVVTAQISEGGQPPFTYVVEFAGDFVASKQDFDAEMFLHTAISVVQSQLESFRHGSTRLKVHRASGLIDTSPL